MRTVSFLRMAMVLSLPILVLARDQQARTFTWSSTNCSDGAEATWTGCKMVHSGDRLSEPGLVFRDGLFVEEMDGPNVNVAVTVTKIKSNFLIHVGFKSVTADHPYTIVPADAVKVVSTSVIRPTTPKDVPENLEVVKLRFKEHEPVTVGSDLWTFGYLFFPSDDLAFNITVVVKIGNESFRFPFANKPDAPLEWVDPQSKPPTVASTASAPSPPPTPSQKQAPPTSTSPATTPVTTTPATVLTSATVPTPNTTSTYATSSPACDIVIGFAIAGRDGVHPGVMGWTRNWINKNAKNYPNVAFQACSAKSLRNYLIVFSSSASVLNGFEPVLGSNTSTSISPVSGTGTVSNMYGSTWFYTYSGTVTTTTTTTTQENVPYTIQSNTMYATAYDEHGYIISQRWHTFSSKQGGDGANTLGYNLGSALAAINARGHLLNAVVKDITGKNRN